MPEVKTSILVAITDPEKKYDDRYMDLSEAIAFAEGDNRLTIENGMLMLWNRKFIEMVTDLPKEPGVAILLFQKSVICAKCSTQNDANKTKTEYDAFANLLKRTCRNCTYQWFERPADWKEPPQQEEGNDGQKENPPS